jgi:hypothetical protein
MFAFALEFVDFLVIGVLIATLAGGSVYAFFKPADRARLRRVEHKLDLLLKQLAIPIPDPGSIEGLSEETRKLADAGDKIGAIRRHRDGTGASLKEAKDAVEAYLASHIKE